jgi:integrase
LRDSGGNKPRSRQEIHRKPETLATLSSFASRISKICGIDFYAHCLRHYFATYLIRKGVPSQTIVKIVGWESAGMLAIYDDRTDDEAIGEGIKDISL